jgi:ketosteroid isomerase-like protein
MATNDPLGTVQRMFAAFRAGDLDGILETVHSDSRWIYVGANPKPTRAELVGHANVRRFFEAIIRRLELKAFETIEFVVQGDTVVVFGSESGALRNTGAAFRNEWVQKYVVRDNHITQMAEYNIQVDPRN